MFRWLVVWLVLCSAAVAIAAAQMPSSATAGDLDTWAEKKKDKKPKHVNDTVPWDDDAKSKYVASVVVVRHADRAAQRHAPAYAGGGREDYDAVFPIDKQDWPVDYEQLTGVGMKQAYEFGYYMRERYVGKSKLLSKVYNHYETHARSTDVDRTLVTAMAIMAGLYPGNSIQDGVRGTVLMPVHTVPYATDALLDGSGGEHCPKFAHSSKEALKSDDIHDAIRNSTSLYDALPALSGVSKKKLKDMKRLALVKLITSLRDLRVCQKAHNVSQPKNVTKHDDDLERLTTLITQRRWSSHGELAGGRLLRAVGKRLRAMVAVEEGKEWALDALHQECNAKGSDSDEDGNCARKLTLYTGHDTTIFDLRAALGVNVTVEGVVPYLSHVVFELSSHKDKYTVKVYEGSYLGYGNKLSGPFCNGSSSCSLKDFERFVEERVPEDVDEACDVKTDERSSSDSDALLHTRLALTICAVLLAASLIALCVFLRARGGRRSGYRSIEHED